MKVFRCSQKELLGYIACWSVIQSPVTCPENLAGVLQLFAEETVYLFPKSQHGILTATDEEISAILNPPKSAFIALGALKRNIINCLDFEQQRTDAFENKYKAADGLHPVDNGKASNNIS